MSPFPLQAQDEAESRGPSQTFRGPLPCADQSDGERGTRGEEKVLPLEMVRKPSLVRRVWRKLQLRDRRGAGKGAMVGMSNPWRG